MPPSAAIVVPTRGRPGYLETALASIAPQAAAHGADLVVVDDGPDERTRALAARFGARYVDETAGRGLNAARNAGAQATGADLVVYVDDDVRVHDGWLAALLRAAQEEPEDVGALTGPIAARIEGRRFPVCRREGWPITWQDEGPRDVDVRHGWGANLAVRRSALERVGLFDPSLSGGGDEREWEERWRADGGRIRYVAAAGVDHRRSGSDARLRALCAAARRRGMEVRWDDERRGEAPGLAHEARVLAWCALHGPRRRCAMGPVMTAATLGRLEAALRVPPPPRAVPGEDDFAAGRSGTLAGRRAWVAAAGDALLDAADVLSGRRRRLRRRAAALPRRRVLVVAIERPDLENRIAEARTEIARSRHAAELLVAPATGAGKFERLNEVLAGRDLGGLDWLVVLDDDVDLPRGFLDGFLAAAEGTGLRIAQPAHRRRSHAAWPVTRRAPGSTVRETTFVEIGPVTALHRDTFMTLLPFPALRMGWGLDARWSALAAERGWPIGVVDGTPVGHTLRPAAATYPREAAIAEARAFLAGRDYVGRHEARTVRVHP